MLKPLGMEPERKPTERTPDVVDLSRYRKAVTEAKRAPPPPKSEPVLGPRPNALLMILLVIGAVAVAFVVPRMF